MIRKVPVSISLDKRTLEAIRNLQGYDQNRSEAIASLVEYAVYRLNKVERNMEI